LKIIIFIVNEANVFLFEKDKPSPRHKRLRVDETSFPTQKKEIDISAVDLSAFLFLRDLPMDRPQAVDGRDWVLVGVLLKHLQHVLVAVRDREAVFEHCAYKQGAGSEEK